MVHDLVEMLSLRKTVVSLDEKNTAMLNNILLNESDTNKEIKKAITTVMGFTSDPNIISKLMTLSVAEKMEEIRIVKVAMEKIEALVVKKNKSLARTLENMMTENEEMFKKNTIHNCGGRNCTLEQWLQ